MMQENPANRGPVRKGSSFIIKVDDSVLESAANSSHHDREDSVRSDSSFYEEPLSHDRDIGDGDGLVVPKRSKKKNSVLVVYCPDDDGHTIIDPTTKSHFLNVSRIFKATFLMQVLINFDSGCIPASTVAMGRQINIDYTQMGMMGGLPYLGLTITGFYGGYLLTTYSPRYILTVACFLNGVACIVFAFGEGVGPLLFARLLVGLSQAFHCIYAPVWVDMHAPEESKTLYMSLLQLSIPLGIMFGYGAGICTAENEDLYFWRYPFIVQGFLIIIASMAIMAVPDELLCMQTVKEEDEESEEKSSCYENFLDALGGVCNILRSGVWSGTVLGLTSLYFIVTAIQFWITEYMVEELGHDMVSVGVGFVICSSTAPTGGVIVGGLVIDKLGGYSGSARQVKIALSALIIPVIVAAACCLIAIFLTGYYPLLFMIWLMLFAGGMVVPGSMGIAISSVAPDMRAFSSSVSLMIFNIFGYFLAPTLSGVIMSTTGSRTIGFNTVLLWSLWGVIFFSIALLSARRDARNERNQDEVDAAIAASDPDAVGSKSPWSNDRSEWRDAPSPPDGQTNKYFREAPIPPPNMAPVIHHRTSVMGSMGISDFSFLSSRSRSVSNARSRAVSNARHPSTAFGTASSRSPTGLQLGGLPEGQLAPHNPGSYFDSFLQPATDSDFMSMNNLTMQLPSRMRNSHMKRSGHLMAISTIPRAGSVMVGAGRNNHLKVQGMNRNNRAVSAATAKEAERQKERDSNDLSRADSGNLRLSTSMNL